MGSIKSPTLYTLNNQPFGSLFSLLNLNEKSNNLLEGSIILVKINISTEVKIWLVVSTHLKNISQTGNLPQIGMNIKNI